MRLYALLLVFLLSCAPPPPAHPKPPGTVISVVFYNTTVHQDAILRGMADQYRDLDVDFAFSYDLGPSITLLVTDEKPEEWKQLPTVVGVAPQNCHRPAGGVGIVFMCSRNEEICSYSGSHELAHILGLEHVVGEDLMAAEYKHGLRFTDRELPTLQHVCRETQDSLATLREALEPAPGPRP